MVYIFQKRVTSSSRCRLFFQRYRSHSWMISRRLGSFTCCYYCIVLFHHVALCSRSSVGSLLAGRSSSRGVVCPLPYRVLHASVIRWRSEGFVSPPVSSRTSGITKLCAYRASSLQPLCYRLGAVGFAYGEMGQFGVCARTQAGYLYVRPR